MRTSRKQLFFFFFSFLSQFHLIETELYFRYVLLALTPFAYMLKSCDVKLMIRDLNCVPQMTFCKRVYPYTLQTDTCQLQLLNLIQRAMLWDRPEWEEKECNSWAVPTGIAFILYHEMHSSCLLQSVVVRSFRVCRLTRCLNHFKSLHSMTNSSVQVVSFSYIVKCSLLRLSKSLSFQLIAITWSDAACER